MVKKINLRAAVPGYLLNLQFLIFSLKKRASIVMPINKIIFLFVFFAGLLFLSCNPTEPGNAPAGLEFKAEDASCTEAWLTLKAGNITGAKVFREDSLIYSFNTNSIDTTLFDEGLLPNQIYKYHTVIQPSNNSRVVTKELTLQTMDTTSHNFTWQMFEFGGDAGSSALNDVAIIDENNIWAVGEIYLKDSLGTPDPHAYNAVHWDGQKWELKRIMFYIDQDQPSNGKIASECEASFLFADNTLAISSNVQTFILKPDGSSKIIKMGFQWKDRFTINSIWGISSNDLYAVGNNGSIAHYDGTNWQKIESGTGADINDIFGAINSSTGETGIYVVASSILYNPERKFIKIVDNKIVYQKDFEYEIFLSSVWLAAGRKIYVTTWNGKIYTFNNNHWKILDYKTEYAQTHIRGTDYNDIFVAGSFGFLTHFNGVTWKQITDVNQISSVISSIDINNKTIVVVGTLGSKATVKIGKRN